MLPTKQEIQELTDNIKEGIARLLEWKKQLEEDKDEPPKIEYTVTSAGNVYEQGLGIFISNPDDEFTVEDIAKKLPCDMDFESFKKTVYAACIHKLYNAGKLIKIEREGRKFYKLNNS